MAEVYPGAEWRPFSGKSTTALTHDIVCLHTIVGTLAGAWSYANGAGNPYWHFGVGGAGAVWQCQDLRYRSAANLNGNWHVIPIETEDKGAYFQPDWGSSCGNVPYWTAAQVTAIVDLVAWLCVRYGIPPVLIPDTAPGRRGIAYHRQGVNPWRCSTCELWSNSTGKCCPDWRRIEQLVYEVIPRVQALVNPPQGDWFDMATREDLKAVLDEWSATNKVNGTASQVKELTAWGHYHAHNADLFNERRPVILTKESEPTLWYAVSLAGRYGPVTQEEASHLVTLELARWADQAHADVGWAKLVPDAEWPLVTGVPLVGAPTPPP